MERRVPLARPTPPASTPSVSKRSFIIAPAQVERVSDVHFSLQSSVRLSCLPANVEYECLVKDPRSRAASCVLGTLMVAPQRTVEHCGLCRVWHAAGDTSELVRTASAKAWTTLSLSGTVLQLHVAVMLSERADGLISQTVVRV